MIRFATSSFELCKLCKVTSNVLRYVIRSYRRNFEKSMIFHIELSESNTWKNSAMKRPLLRRTAAACNRTIFKGRLLMSFCYPGRGSGNTAGRLCSVLHPFSVLSPQALLSRLRFHLWGFSGHIARL
ncbi:hypothetical protein ACS0PU_009003 [Formica fusca]